MTDAPAGQGALGGSHGRVSRFMGNLMIMENVAPSPLCLPLGLPETPGDLCPLMKSTCACLSKETHLRPLPPADAAPRLEVTVRGHRPRSRSDIRIGSFCRESGVLLSFLQLFLPNKIFGFHNEIPKRILLDRKSNINSLIIGLPRRVVSDDLEKGLGHVLGAMGDQGGRGELHPHHPHHQSWGGGWKGVAGKTST